MSDNTVRFKIKIDGIDGFKEAEISAENLGDVISGVINKAEGLAKF